LQALDQGIPVDLDWILSSEHLDCLCQLIGDARPTRIRPLLEQLPVGITRDHVELYLQARGLHE
jgi:hypothetical protein